MPPLQSADPGRKERGDYRTPHWLVDEVVANAVPAGVEVAGRTVTVLDPACGDGRFLVAAGRRLLEAGAAVELVGLDIDRDALADARRHLGTHAVGMAWRVEEGDALAVDWGASRFDVVVGNPPYLSQLATATTRGGASLHGGGPYADAAAEFLGLAGRLVRPDGGRIGLVLPQSILASRDAAGVRAELDRIATLTWSWWSPQRVFDAGVLVCALAFEARHRPARAAGADPTWSHVVTSTLEVPPVPTVASAGVLGDRARLTANFRDQYYGLVPAVVEGGDGPPLVTSGLVDPAKCWWGEREVTFARRRFRRPAVELDRLDPAMRRWADGMLVPKVLIANQTRIVEAVADPCGQWLPGVPLVTARPAPDPDAVWALAAVLTSPVASAWAWHRAAGTGLSARTLRLGPRWLTELPWPAGDLAPAVAALRAGDVAACALGTMDAYGLDPRRAASRQAMEWWLDGLPRARTVPGRGSQRR